MENGFSNVGRIIIISSLALALSAPTAFAQKGKKKAPERVPGELIIKLKNAPTEGSRTQAGLISQLESVAGTGAVLKFESFKTDKSLQLVKLKSDAAVAQAIKALRSESSVKYAEPNYKLRIFNRADPNDAEFGKLWGMKNTGQTDAGGQVGTPGSDINVAPLWQRGMTGSRRVLVGVIDTGISWTHPDLVNNIWTNSREIAGNGVDDDGNGFIDDIHGWNFYSKTAESSDDHDHGTHCAGTIGAEGNNGIGVAGVNWAVSFLPIKFLSAQGSGSLADAVEAIKYATKMGVDMTSNSWGGGGFSQTMMDAIAEARDKGILFIAAAGNDSSDNDSSPAYPASYDLENVISVAATDNKDTIATFSNWGKSKVHVAAPGVKVWSSTKDGAYKAFSGTSMATPHVAGIAALLKSEHPEWGFAEIKQRLIQTSTPIRGLRKKVVAKGRVNAYNAMMGIIPPTNEPDERLWRDAEYRAESEHPYKPNTVQTFTVEATGVRYIRLHFSQVDLERNYDKITIETPTGEVIDTITGSVTDPNGYTTDYVEGGKLIVKFTSDGSVEKQGWTIDKMQVIRRSSTSPNGRPDELVMR